MKCFFTIVNCISPEGLNTIFDSLPSLATKTLLDAAVTAFNDDVDSLAWLCGYMADEINHSSDNNKENLPITKLSKVFIELGMAPFVDFMPNYFGQFAITNVDKFKALPPDIRAMLSKQLGLMEFSHDYVHVATEEFK